MPKKWYRSKTIWINMLMAASVLYQVLTGDDILDADAQAVIILIINIILRIITGKPLST